MQSEVVLVLHFIHLFDHLLFLKKNLIVYFWLSWSSLLCELFISCGNRLTLNHWATREASASSVNIYLGTWQALFGMLRIMHEQDTSRLCLMELAVQWWWWWGMGCRAMQCWQAPGAESYLSGRGWPGSWWGTQVLDGKPIELQAQSPLSFGQTVHLAWFSEPRGLIGVHTCAQIHWLTKLWGRSSVAQTERVGQPLTRGHMRPRLIRHLGQWGQDCF